MGLVRRGDRGVELAHVFERNDDLQIELLLRTSVDELDLSACSHDEATDLGERSLGRGEADPLERFLDQALEALEAEREVRAALRPGDRVHLVHDHRLDRTQRLTRP